MSCVSKQYPQLVTGSYEPVAAQGDLLLYRRAGEGGAIVIALNLGARACYRFHRVLSASTVRSCYRRQMDRRGERVEGALDLRANEGVILGTPLEPFRRAPDHAG